MYICIYVYIYIYVCIYMCIYICVYINICIYIYMYICICQVGSTSGWISFTYTPLLPNASPRFYLLYFVLG